MNLNHEKGDMGTKKLCGKPLPKAKNGVDRGTCSLLVKHGCPHGGRNVCYQCGIILNDETASPSIVSHGCGLCRSCSSEYYRKNADHQPRNIQHYGCKHTFSCGCEGVLPQKLGQVNKFAITSSKKGFHCRVSIILGCSKQNAKTHGYTPVDSDTPHSVIRKLMEEPNCERCGQPLKWEFGYGKTPHLHHNHETGEIYGFTHPICNPHALEKEIERLRKENGRLRESLRRKENGS